MVAGYAKEHNPSVAEKIAAYSKRIVELFRQTEDYSSVWDSTEKEHRRAGTTEDYAVATAESLDILSKWAASQEKLRCTILEFVELLYSVVSES